MTIKNKKNLISIFFLLSYDNNKYGFEQLSQL